MHVADSCYPSTVTKIAVSLDLWHKNVVDADIGQNYKKHQLVLLMFVIFYM